MDVNMSDTPRTKRYDTNPLDPKVAERAEREMGPFEPEAPTQPMPPETAAYTPPPPPQMFAETPGQFGARPGANLGLQPNCAAALCYAPFVGIVASILLLQSEPRENQFVRFHAKQALFAHITFWAVAIVFGIARAITPTIASIVLALPQLAFYVAGVAGLVFMMIRTYRYQTVKIPVIGDQVE
jgi:uncharacterized membrane protein